jgi:hypothetical protein
MLSRTWMAGKRRASGKKDRPTQEVRRGEKERPAKISRAFPTLLLPGQLQTGVIFPPRASNSAFGIGNAVLYASVAVCFG